MTDQNIGPEDIELGEPTEVYEAAPRRGVRLRVDLPPEFARPLLQLSERTGADPFELARELLMEAMAGRLDAERRANGTVAVTLQAEEWAALERAATRARLSVSELAQTI